MNEEGKSERGRKKIREREREEASKKERKEL